MGSVKDTPRVITNYYTHPLTAGLAVDKGTNYEFIDRALEFYDGILYWRVLTDTVQEARNN